MTHDELAAAPASKFNGLADDSNPVKVPDHLVRHFLPSYLYRDQSERRPLFTDEEMTKLSLDERNALAPEREAAERERIAGLPKALGYQQGVGRSVPPAKPAETYAGDAEAGKAATDKVAAR